MHRKPLKILAIPALVALSLVVATSAHSLARTQDSHTSTSVALSQVGRTTLVVWHGGSADLAAWQVHMLAQYAGNGLMVQPLQGTPADVRGVHQASKRLRASVSGLMVFDTQGRLRVSAADPEVGHFSAAEVSVQALLGQRELPGWVGQSQQIKRHMR